MSLVTDGEWTSNSRQPLWTSVFNGYK